VKSASRFSWDQSSIEQTPRQLLPVVCVVRPIAVGDMVREIDVELRSADQTGLNGQPVHTLDEVVGRQATRDFASGHVLDARFLRKPVLVTRGQAVAVVAKAAGVRAKTTARALEDGTQGDLILVESIDTKQRYSAIVTGTQQAEVLATGATVADPVRRTAASSNGETKR
jgi:flagella basal body P-ring formation protein FlgA